MIPKSPEEVTAEIQRYLATEAFWMLTRARTTMLSVFGDAALAESLDPAIAALGERSGITLKTDPIAQRRARRRPMDGDEDDGEGGA